MGAYRKGYKMDDMTKITAIPGAQYKSFPPTDDHLTDAQWAAHEASRALADGRYRLAESLVALARRAQYAEDNERASTGLAYDDPAARIAYATRDSLNIGVQQRTIPLIGTTRIEKPNDISVPTEKPISRAPRTCEAEFANGNMCRQPIAWSAGSIGFLGGPAPTQAGWYHLDPEITDHDPEIDPRS